MQFEWDNRKNKANIIKHKLDFETVGNFAWHEAVVFERSRPEDAEQRFVAVGMLEAKIHTVVFTSRGMKTRIISVRRANKQEEHFYEKETQIK
jgi:uncharacterized protein